jgi:hypothetical protein
MGCRKCGRSLGALITPQPAPIKGPENPVSPRCTGDRERRTVEGPRLTMPNPEPSAVTTCASVQLRYSSRHEKLIALAVQAPPEQVSAELRLETGYPGYLLALGCLPTIHQRNHQHPPPTGTTNRNHQQGLPTPQGLRDNRNQTTKRNHQQEHQQKEPLTRKTTTYKNRKKTQRTPQKVTRRINNQPNITNRGPLTG